MSKRRHKGLTSTHLLIVFSVMLVCVAGAIGFWYLSWDANASELNRRADAELHDPLPGELVVQAILDDSIHDARREQLRTEMTKVIQDYRKKFRQDHFTGYFMTDLDSDGFPELWVKVGNYRDNSKLELYYPMPDGTLRKSDTFAEPGKYYIGDGYLMQVVGSGPGYIDVNRISIRNGEMHIVNERNIDLYGEPGVSMPVFAERAIRDTSFSNLSALNKALNL